MHRRVGGRPWDSFKLSEPVRRSTTRSPARRRVPNAGCSFSSTRSGACCSHSAVPALGLWSLAMPLPGLGVALRRLHDTGRSALLLLTGLIVPRLIALCREDKVEGNPYAVAGAGPTATITERSVQANATYCANCGKMRIPVRNSALRAERNGRTDDLDRGGQKVATTSATTKRELANCSGPTADGAVGPSSPYPWRCGVVRQRGRTASGP